MTAAQHRVLKSIQNLVKRLGHAPTYQEIAQESRLRALSVVCKHVTALEHQGYIIRDKHTHRNIVLVPKSLDGWSTCEDQHPRVYFREKNCPVCEVLRGQHSPKEISTSPSSP